MQYTPEIAGRPEFLDILPIGDFLKINGSFVLAMIYIGKFFKNLFISINVYKI